MDTPAAPLVAHNAAVSAVFKAGMPVYLRRRSAGMDKIVLVSCAGAGVGMLVMQWSDIATHGPPPRAGEEVTCQALMQGVLYVAKGRVEEITQGKQPRLRIRTDDNCIAVPLRKLPRYGVSGRLRLSQIEPPLSYSQNTFHAINISLGGFGIELAKDAWSGGDEVYFVLELLVERKDLAGADLPGLTIEGAGLIRRRHELPEHNTLYVGVQFADLEQEQQEALEFWLAAHRCYIRAA